MKSEGERGEAKEEEAEEGEEAEEPAAAEGVGGEVATEREDLGEEEGGVGVAVRGGDLDRPEAVGVERDVRGAGGVGERRVVCEVGEAFVGVEFVADGAVVVAAADEGDVAVGGLGCFGGSVGMCVVAIFSGGVGVSVPVLGGGVGVSESVAPFGGGVGVGVAVGVLGV